MTNIVLKFMNLFIDGLAINRYELVEERGGESFDSSIIKAIFFFQYTTQFLGTLVLIIYVVQIIRKCIKNSIAAVTVYLLLFHGGVVKG